MARAEFKPPSTGWDALSRLETAFSVLYVGPY